jgi:hypothetical protein
VIFLIHCVGGSPYSGQGSVTDEPCGWQNKRHMPLSRPPLAGPGPLLPATVAALICKPCPRCGGRVELVEAQFPDQARQEGLRELTAEDERKLGPIPEAARAEVERQWRDEPSP